MSRILLLAVAVVLVNGRLKPSVHAVSSCAVYQDGAGSPAFSQLQDDVALYYPALARERTLPYPMVVGFVVDTNCRVVTHSAAFMPPQLRDADALLLLLFPDLRIERALGTGIAGPPQWTDRRGYVLVVWAMFRGKS